MLKHFAKTLQSRGIAHRLDMSDANAERWWPYSTSRERIFFLAGVRNKALEPIQSHDEAIRIPGHDTFTKIIFLNDIYFSYESIVRLLASRIDGDATLPGDYDLACAIDYGSSGLYFLPRPYKVGVAHAEIPSQVFTTPGSQETFVESPCEPSGRT